MATPATYFIGDAAGGWTEDFWPRELGAVPNDLSLDMVVFETGKPVRHGDLNLISQLAFTKLRDHVRQLLTSGWTTLGTLAPGAGQHQVSMQESWLNISGQVVHVGNPDAAQYATTLTLPAQPNSGSRTDLVYLEMWLQEVGSVPPSDAADKSLFKWGGIANTTYANGLFWNVGPGTEPSRRVQLRWALRSTTGVLDLTTIGAQGGAGGITGTHFALVESSDDALTPIAYRAGAGDSGAGATFKCTDGYVWALPVAQVVRVAGETVIQPTAITDVRTRCFLRSGIVVNQTNIYPAITNDNALEHLTPSDYVYAGTSVLGYTPPGTFASFDLSQAAHAVKFTVPALPVGPPEGTTAAFPLRRLTLSLAKIGTGHAVSVDLCTGTSSTPGAVLASATIPASWLSFTARNISFYVNYPALAQGATYWLVVHKGGDAFQHALLSGSSVADGGATFMVATDGATFSATSALPFSYALYSGISGNVIFVRENFTDLYYFEYDNHGNVANIGESYTPATAALAYDAYRRIDYAAGVVLDIA